MKNYYALLSVAQDTPADEIKKAFRREIARYHPDKVQHLGQEFQEMAAGIAADLTEAYRILMDPGLRATYDQQLSARGADSPSPGVPAATPAAPPSPSPDPEPSFSSGPAPAPPRPTAGLEFVRRAAISKIRGAIDELLTSAVPVTAPGFDIAIVTSPKRGLFKKAEESLCLLVKFVPFVDADAVAQNWPAAAKVRAPGVSACVIMLVGPGLAPVKDLSAAVTDQRRKARTQGGPVLVPVDVRNWDTLFPPDTPEPVRAVIQRLKDEKR